MLRLFVLLAAAGAASAQGLHTPYVPPTNFPTAPQPYYGIGGGARYYGAAGINAYSPFAAPYYSYSSYAMPYLPYYTPAYRVLPAPAPAVAEPVANLAPDTAISKEVAGAEFAARLDLSFPAPAAVWLDGTRTEGSESADVSLTSPPLKVGAGHTFKVTATWSADGTKYRVERSVTVKAGERSRLIVVTGDVAN